MYARRPWETERKMSLSKPETSRFQEPPQKYIALQYCLPPAIETISLSPRPQNLTTHNPHLLHRPISPPSLDTPQLLHNLHTIDHMSKDCVSSVQMPRGSQRDEELASIRVRAGIGHGENSGGRVRELGGDFVREAAAVDGGAAAAGARGVAGLDHEVADDAVGGDGVVVACCGEGGEVVAGLGMFSRWTGLLCLLIDEYGSSLFEQSCVMMCQSFT